MYFLPSSFKSRNTFLTHKTYPEEEVKKYHYVFGRPPAFTTKHMLKWLPVYSLPAVPAA